MALSNNPYVYEWVVKEDGSTWTVDNGETNQELPQLSILESCSWFFRQS